MEVFLQISGFRDPKLKRWDVLQSKSTEYQLQCFLFNGCFSDIAVCKNRENKETVAIKIFKKRDNCHEPDREMAMLMRISDQNSDNIVTFLEGFERNRHTCLVFELLDMNLHELLRQRGGIPLSIHEIKAITRQLLDALETLKTIGVIHTNIKSHNIMLVNHKDKPFRVKLIDFGSAVLVSEVQRGIIMQSVAYRSPDVILGLPISEAVDMWSLGVVLATLYLGHLPFPQKCQYHLIKSMVETLGRPEAELLSDGIYTQLYFNLNHDSTKLEWRLKTEYEYQAATGDIPQKQRSSTSRFHGLDELEMLHPEENFKDRIRFVRLLKMMLEINPHRRITPREALIHPFLTLGEVDDNDENDTSFSIVASASMIKTLTTSKHRDTRPKYPSSSSEEDTADRALAVKTPTAKASAASKPRHQDSAVCLSRVENTPAVTSDNKVSEDASVAPAVTRSNDPISADDSTTVDEALGTSTGEESNVTGPVRQASSSSAFYTSNRHSDVSSNDQALDADDEASSDLTDLQDNRRSANSSTETQRRMFRRVRRLLHRMNTILRLFLHRGH